MKEAPHPIHRFQWILDFKFRQENKPDLGGEVFILNIDSDKDHEAELLQFMPDSMIAGVGQRRTVKDNELWEIDFRGAFFRKYTDRFFPKTEPCRSPVQWLLLHQKIDKTLTSEEGAFPECRGQFPGLGLKVGRGIQIPYRGIGEDDDVYHSVRDVSWDEFKTEVAAMVASGGKYVYRGQADSRWALTPSYMRLRQDNDLITSRYIRHLREVQGDPSLISKKILDRVAELQHKFKSTFLLDWSESFMVAAHFACDLPEDNFTAAHLSIFASEISGFEHDSPGAFSEQLVTFFKPKGVASELERLKIERQKAYLSLSKLRTLMQGYPSPNPLKKVWRISRDQVPQIQSELRREGICDDYLMLRHY